MNAVLRFRILQTDVRLDFRVMRLGVAEASLANSFSRSFLAHNVSRNYFIWIQTFKLIIFLVEVLRSFFAFFFQLSKMDLGSTNKKAQEHLKNAHCEQDREKRKAFFNMRLVM